MEKRAPGYRDEILPCYVGIILQTVVGICNKFRGYLGVALTMYPGYLLCSLRIPGERKKLIPTI